MRKEGEGRPQGSSAGGICLPDEVRLPLACPDSTAFPLYATGKGEEKPVVTFAGNWWVDSSCEKVKIWISSPSSPERSWSYKPRFHGQALALLGRSSCSLPSCLFGFVLRNSRMLLGVVWAQLCPCGGFGEKAGIVSILSLSNGTVLSAI